MSEPYDIAIVGSGFAGSLLAMIARRQGRSVILIEKDTHPRVVIGESSTPLSNLLLEELAVKYDLPMLAPFAKWGSWQRHYPEVACGLKRGFTFQHHLLGNPQPPGPARQEQLLVAASPRDEIADTHWYRADFDHFLMRQARELGADYVEETRLRRFVDLGETVKLEGERRGAPVSFSAKVVFDATGPRGFLHQALQLGELELPGLPATLALFNHFTGVKRLSDNCANHIGDTPPYLIDDAAVHHVFDGGWVWVLQFNNGVTSAGVAATSHAAERLGLADGCESWKRLLALIPALKLQFQCARPERQFTYVPKLSYRSAKMAGDKWALLPSAAGFVDPLLSTGIPLALLGISRLGEILASDWATPRLSKSLDDYAAKTDAELNAASRLIGALYANMSNFPVFTSLSMLYFAAVSYAEASRRLGKVELASSFLLHDHPTFGPSCRQILERAHQPRSAEQTDQLIRDIACIIEPINVAGLGDRTRRNWYPVVACDLLNAAHKLGASREQIQQLLWRSGFLTGTEATASAAAHSLSAAPR